MKTFTFKTEIFLRHPLEEVFAFFSDAGNLEKITPPWVKFRILSLQPIHMAVGTRIRYRLSLRGLPVNWESKITIWDPPHCFVDDQLKGPYTLWHHEHIFRQQDGGTLMRDQVTYAVPGGSLVNRFFVEPDLKKIFAYREKVMKELFPG